MYHIVFLFKSNSRQGNCIMPQWTVCHFTSLHFTSLPFTSLHFTSLHFPSLPFTSLHFPSLPFPSLPFTSLHFTSVHFTSLHFTSLPFPSLPFPSDLTSKCVGGLWICEDWVTLVPKVIIVLKWEKAGVDGKKERSTALHFLDSMYGTLRTDHEHRTDRQNTEFIWDK